MRYIKLLIVMLLTVMQQLHSQEKSNNMQEINDIIEKYSKSVIQRDSVTFYSLFNTENVTWCAALKDSSQFREVEAKGAVKAGTGYFFGSYKSFLRSLFRYKATEDKFDNIHITEDGTVATVNMDYSFWADNKMTNWGSKYLTLIKREGYWKITAVVYSLELTQYYKQPYLAQRQKKKG